MLGEREADGLVPRVVDVVEPLEPRVPVDEVEALAARRAQVAHDQVEPVGGAPDGRVELHEDRGEGREGLVCVYRSEGGGERRKGRGRDVRSGARAVRSGRTRTSPVAFARHECSGRRMLGAIALYSRCRC